MIFLDLKELEKLSDCIESQFPEIAKKLNQMKDTAKAQDRSYVMLEDMEQYHVVVTVSEDDLQDTLKSNGREADEDTLDAFRAALDGFNFRSDVDDALNYIVNEELDSYM